MPADVAHAEVADTSATIRFGDNSDLSRPVDPDWVAAARAQGIIVLTCGKDPLPGEAVAQLDPYLARFVRLLMGLIHLRAVR